MIKFKVFILQIKKKNIWVVKINEMFIQYFVRVKCYK